MASAATALCPRPAPRLRTWPAASPPRFRPRTDWTTEWAVPTRVEPDPKIEVARWRAVVLVAVVLSSILLGLSALVGAPGGEPLAAPGRANSAAQLQAGATYVVQPGDTYWSIAGRLSPDADPRPVVDRMVAARGGAPLLAGERIELPGS